jgi:hypothetical protein
MTDEERYALTIELAKVIKTDMMEEYLLYAPDIPGIPPEEQTIMKMCALLGACEAIVNAGHDLVRRLETGLPPKENSGKIEQEETDSLRGKEKKEWN